MVTALIEDAVKDDSFIASIRGPRGLKGASGKDFIFEDHQDEIKQQIIDYISKIQSTLKLKFSDLSEEEKESLRGVKGDSVSQEEITAAINTLYDGMKDGLKLRFTDLTNEEKESLKGASGRDGSDFDFEENKENIFNVIEANKDLFKLHFSDLTEDEKFLLRGPRGQRGRGFKFEENIEEINSLVETHLKSIQENLKLRFADLTESEKDLLKLKFNHLTDEEKEGLKLHFSDLTESEKDTLKLTFSNLTDEEKESLKLHFSDLSEEDRNQIRGPRGQRGKKGHDFIWDENHENISTEIKGYITEIKDDLKLRYDDLSANEKQSLRGPRGLAGLTGIAGKDGKDAPLITDVEVEIINDTAYLIFYFSDGTTLSTNRFLLPKINKIVNQYMALGSGGDGGLSAINVEKDGTLVKEVDTINFVGDKINVVTNGEKVDVSVKEVEIYDEGEVATLNLRSIDFVGEGVSVLVQTTMGDWVNLEDLPTMDHEELSAGNIKVLIPTPDTSTKLAIRKICGEDMSRLRAVSLVDSDTIFLSDKDTRPVVDGLLIEDGLTGERKTVVMFGIVEDVSFGWPLKATLYLGDNGVITTTFPTSGYMVVIGKSLGNGAIFIDIQEPEAV